MRAKILSALFLVMAVMSITDSCIAMKLNKTSISIMQGRTYKLKANNKTGKIKWKSSDPQIAKVSKSGNVRAVQIGNATITATCNKVSKSCKVKVKKCTKHVFDSDNILTEASCNSAGKGYHECVYCGNYEEYSIPKLEHNWSVYNVTTPASCEKSGVETSTCTICGEIRTREIAALSHTWDEGKITTESTCNKHGVKTYTCISCKQTKTEDLAFADHNWQLTTTNTPATCDSEGEGVYTCSVCKRTKTQKIPKTKHTYKSKIIAPTCTTDGYTQFTCTLCGDTYIGPNSSISKLGHTFLFTKTVSPTLSAQGYDVYTCSGCKITENRNYTWYDPSKDGTLAAKIKSITIANDTKAGLISWTESSFYSWAGANEDQGIPASQYGTFAFATICSDKLFGIVPATKVVCTESGSSNIRIGDIAVTIDSDNTEHAWFVTEVSGNTLVVGDSMHIDSDDGAGNVIRSDVTSWGSMIDSSQVKYYLTRYY